MTSIQTLIGVVILCSMFNSFLTVINLGLYNILVKQGKVEDTPFSVVLSSIPVVNIICLIIGGIWVFSITKNT